MPNNLKILLLEDDYEDVEIIQHILQENIPGMEYHFAANKHAYLAALSHINPDCILADNSITGMNAATALATAREHFPDVPFIMVTGSVPETYAIDMLKAGADDYVIKDRLQRLPSAIEAAVNKYRAEQQKEFDRNNLSALINNTKDMMWSTDSELRLVTFNNAFNEVVIGLSGKPLQLGDSVIADQFPQELIAYYSGHYRRALAGESFTIIDHFGEPLDLWSEISFYPILKDGTVTGIACFARDITEAKKSEQTMRKMEKEIMHQQIQEQKKISRAIIHAQEQERNRIGQELHDNVNQILAATKIFLTNAAKSDAAKESIRYPIQLIDNSIEEIRSLSSRQVTPLKNIHLKVMIEELIDKMQANAKLKAVFEYNDHEDHMDDDLKLNIYRIIQEQVNNIVKYAAAKNVLVSIHTKNDGTHIVISDDGKGFDTGKKRKGIGISNMINRVEAFNGTIHIDSAPGMGCRVSFMIPVVGYIKDAGKNKSA